MKASCVLLRWYKSFNVNYLGYPDRKHQVKERPWTSLRISPGMDDRFKFIEIPLEPDITTIVGGNESGKSHLLGAVAKVVKGTGIPDEENKALPFDRTDLCHYSSIRNKNADAWPNIGLEFSHVTTAEWGKLSAAAGQPLGNNSPSPAESRFTLICAPTEETVNEDGTKDPDYVAIKAYLYAPPLTEPIALDAATLQKVRDVLPPVHFIKSTVPMRDELPIDDLLAGLGIDHPNGQRFVPFLAAQAAGQFLNALSVPDGNEAPKGFMEALRAAAHAAKQSNIAGTKSNHVTTLEGHLFREVLEIEPSAISLLASLPEEHRSYADSLVGTWNDEIAKVLNLSRYWQQDDLFSLRVNFKRGMLYFELTDKTGAIYTFRERSSGLRYFLSYYIQAKALEKVIKTGNAIILMDEPDSYLSIVGQRNLLSVFESLVGFATGEGHVQLIYTTHSPFLINRNFPRRIRLVRKGDAEEGSQFIEESRVRRYEPVRSALGIDCAQTLFMGSTNVLLEGPTDQYLIGELIRAFSRPENIHDLLDLNTVTLVSAESAPHVRRVLDASKWGDEPTPATVVLFDNDPEGLKQKAMVTGKFNAGKDKKDDKQRYPKLIEEDFVLLISDCLGETLDGAQRCVTVEDTIPVELWCLGFATYLAEWMPTVEAGQRDQIIQHISKGGAQSGVVAAAEAALIATLGDAEGRLDKLGVLQAVIKVLSDGCAAEPPPSWLSVTRTRVVRLCQKLAERIEHSRMAQRRATGKQTVTRLTRDFLVQHPKAAGLFEVEMFLVRVSKESELLGADGTELKKYTSQLMDEIKGLRAQNHSAIEQPVWATWRTRLEPIRENPLDPLKTALPPVSATPAIAEVAEPTIAVAAS